MAAGFDDEYDDYFAEDSEGVVDDSNKKGPFDDLAAGEKKEIKAGDLFDSSDPNAGLPKKPEKA